MKLSRFLFALAVMGAPLSSLAAQAQNTAAPAPADNAASEEASPTRADLPREGELRLDGKLALIGPTWQVQAVSWTSPRGITKNFDDAKTKDVILPANLFVHARGESEKILLKDVKIGARMAVIGKNNSNGTLTAREIVLLEGYGKVKTVGSVPINQFSAALINQAREAFDGGDSLKSITLTEQALRAAEAFKDRPGQGFALSDLGMIYLRTQQYDLAVQNYTKSVEKWKVVGDAQSQAIALNGLAASLIGQGHADKALPFAQQADELPVASPILKESVVRRLATIYFALKMREEALVISERAVPLATAIREWGDAADSSLNVAALVASTDPGRARQALARADDAMKQIGDEKLTAALGATYARVLWLLGDHDAAKTRLAAAAATFDTAGDAKTAAKIRAVKWNGDNTEPVIPIPLRASEAQADPPAETE